MRVSVHACERVCRDTQMHYWTVLPHASRNLEERVVGLGAPPPTQGSLGGTSHNATPSKGRRPRSEVGSDSRGRRSLTCVAAPVSELARGDSQRSGQGFMDTVLIASVP